MSDRRKRPRDPNLLAKLIVGIGTGEVTEHQTPATKRSRGGQKGGLARAAALTKDQRSAIAQKAALARWKKKAL